ASKPCRGSRLQSARPDPDAIAPGLDQPERWADRRPHAGSPTPDDRQGFAPRPAAVAARRPGRIYRVLRLDRSGNADPESRYSVGNGQLDALDRPSRHIEHNKPGW